MTRALDFSFDPQVARLPFRQRYRRRVVVTDAVQVQAENTGLVLFVRVEFEIVPNLEILACLVPDLYRVIFAGIQNLARKGFE